MAKISVEFIDAALELADNGQSKLSEREREIFGLSSARLRALINNTCSVKGATYLELGIYRGATLISALYNNPSCKAVGVDNFSYDEREPKKLAPDNGIWHNMKSQLEANLARYKDKDLDTKLENLQVIESDFKDVLWAGHDKFNIVFFDINPVSTSTYDNFFEKVLPALATDSVIIFSNYSNQNHAKQLEEALVRHSNKLEVQWKRQRVSGGLSDSTQYYSGIAILGVKKKVVKTVGANA